MFSVRSISYLFTVLVAAFLLIGCKPDHPQLEAGTVDDFVDGTSPYVLSVAEVAELLSRPSPPLVVEISKPKEFAKGHLPGAVSLWRPDYEDKENYPYGGIRASKRSMADLLSGIGAKTDSLVVVYCTKGSADAARFLWIMRGYGHDRIAMMDGGKTAWRHAGYSTTKDTTSARPAGDFRFPKGVKQTDYASFHDVVAAVSDTNVILVDTREDYEHFGHPYLIGNSIVPYKPGAYIHGAIPGAIHMNWSESVDLNGDHTFKSLKDLKHNFAIRGITPDKEIILYCQSGVRSAHTTFVLSDLLGYPEVSNYDGSWIEWSYLHLNANLVPVQQHASEDDNQKIYDELMNSLASEGNQ